MARLEDLKPGLHLEGIIPNQIVTVVDVKWHGTSAVELFFKRDDGQPGTQLLFRDDESNLEIVQVQQKWSFSADAQHFRLASEALRIHLAHLFDPVLAVHTSLIEPLPHQITGVYGEMLLRQPLRFLLADDPGAGKTIMAGLLIKELMARGDVKRCLICVPGNLAGQWQDELWFKFQVRFDILTRETFETAVTGNPFLEKDLVIIRLDQIARDESLQEKLKLSEWDLVVVDEAHKMSATFFGGETKYTKRYHLGQLLGRLTRHLLFMTATPHNGKEEDFQLFLALIDPDRFEGRFRQGVHRVDISDIMRRMIKEELLRFDGRPLFPERKAYTVNYKLSPAEMDLYEAVTGYVREEFNRAEQLLDDKRKGTVGFALTVLQRRLASSPEAIYRSLQRRRERLRKRHQEIESAKQQLEPQDIWYDEEFIDDLDEAPAEEFEEIEEFIVDAATAALTLKELEAEIETLRGLEQMAYRVRNSGTDRKWQQLATILQEDEHMFSPAGEKGTRRKMIIFTEHRDTLKYLWGRMSTLFGREGQLAYIDGTVSRDARRKVEDRFRNDPGVHFLLATDAAGEGINLQRANLMVNYDLPWNPNRLEQRFGRIHRIGQQEVCHLWNLVAGETREGYVYQRLLQKLETEEHALNGKVFPILGELFSEKPLRKLLQEAILYGDDPEVRARLEQAVDNAVDQKHVQELLEASSLASDTMDISQIEQVRAEMERYGAKRLQPFYVKSLFAAAFELMGGKMREREPGRYQIRYVPAAIRDRAKALGTTLPVLQQYERVCFDKALISVKDKPLAQFLCPGHPLLDSVIDLTLERYRHALQSGTVLVDSTDPGKLPRMLFFLEQIIHDAAGRSISREMHFVEIEKDEIDRNGHIRDAGSAPYLDYRPATEVELATIQHELEAGWLIGEELESLAFGYAIEHLVLKHLERVRERRIRLVEKTKAAVHARLTKEINYWDARAVQLRQQEKAGKPHKRLTAHYAERKAAELARRLKERMEDLAQEGQISAAPPVIAGGALVVPIGLILGDGTLDDSLDTRITEAIAMKAVAEAEVKLGNHPRDVSKENLGYDIESLDPESGRLRFIEVKGRKAGADTVTVTRNEILTGINSVQQFILALVEIQDGRAFGPRYIREPFDQEPGFEVTSVNYNFQKLLSSGQAPS